MSFECQKNKIIGFVASAKKTWKTLKKLWSLHYLEKGRRSSCCLDDSHQEPYLDLQEQLYIHNSYPFYYAHTQLELGLLEVMQEKETSFC